VGSNSNGELGNGSFDNSTSINRIDFFNNKTVVDICCGMNHTLAITNKGEIFSWGCNDNGFN
jgi:alpha-tubulin suppressor-like RCC1 family protein